MKIYVVVDCDTYEGEDEPREAWFDEQAAEEAAKNFMGLHVVYELEVMDA
jgi:hypothetical protein